MHKNINSRFGFRQLGGKKAASSGEGGNGGGLGAIMTAYKTNVEAEGGSVQAAQLSAGQTLLDTLESNGILSLIDHLWIPLCDDLNGVNIALKANIGDLTMTKRGGWSTPPSYSVANGLAAVNGFDNQLHTGIIPNVDLVVGDISACVVVLAAASSNYAWYLGSESGNNNGTIRMGNGTTNTYAMGLGQGYSYNSPPARYVGVNIMTSVTNTQARWYQNYLQRAENSYSQIVLGNKEIMYMGGLSNTSYQNCGNLRCGGAFIGKKLSAAQAGIIETAILAMNSAISRS